MKEFYKELGGYKYKTATPAERVGFINKLRLTINHQDENGNTLLHHAVKQKDFEFVKIIMEEIENVDPLIKNIEGFSPFILTLDPLAGQRSKTIRGYLLNFFKYKPQQDDFGGVQNVTLEINSDTPTRTKQVAQFLLESGALTNLKLDEREFHGLKLTAVCDFDRLCKYLAENIDNDIVEDIFLEIFHDWGAAYYNSYSDDLISDIVSGVNKKYSSGEEVFNHLLLTFYYIKCVYFRDFSAFSEEMSDSIKVLSLFLKEHANNFNLSNQNITSQLLTYIIFPNRLKQPANKSLCGVMIYLRELVEKSPLRFTLLGINLARNGYSDVPFKGISALSEFYQLKDIAAAMAYAIKNTSNITGYSQDCYFEAIKGATLPKELERWFRESDFEFVSDSITYFDSNNNKISSLHRFFLGGLYSNIRIGVTPDEKIQQIVSEIYNQKAGVFCQLSGQFAALLTKNKNVFQINVSDIQSAEELKSETVLGIDYGHYVKLLSFAERSSSDGETVDLTLYTWGRVMEIKNLPREFFQKHCHGVFITKFNSSLTLAKIEDQNPSLYQKYSG